MGVRLYNPAKGLFTSVDPVDGGSPNVYAYPYDPINDQDLDGQIWGSVLRFGGKYIARAGRWVAKKVVHYATRAWQWTRRNFERVNHRAKAAYGAWLSTRYNGGRARVTIASNVGKHHYDLHGRSHAGVRTPHKYTHYYGKRPYMGKKGPTRAMGWRDLFRVHNYLRQR